MKLFLTAAVCALTCVVSAQDCFLYTLDAECEAEKDTDGDSVCSWFSSSFSSCEPENICKFGSKTNCSSITGCEWTDFGGNEGLCEATDYDSLNQSCYLNAVDNCMTADKCAVATYTDEYCGNSVSDISTTPSQNCFIYDGDGECEADKDTDGDSICVWKSSSYSTCQPENICEFGSKTNCSSITGCEWTDFGGDTGGLCEVSDFDSLDQGCYSRAVDNCTTSDKCALNIYTNEYCTDRVIATTPTATVTPTRDCYIHTSDDECKADKDTDGDNVCMWLTSSTYSCQPEDSCRFGSKTNCSSVGDCTWYVFADGSGVCETTDPDSLDQTCYSVAVDDCSTSSGCMLSTFTSSYCIDFNPCPATSKTECAAVGGCVWNAWGDGDTEGACTESSTTSSVTTTATSTIGTDTCDKSCAPGQCKADALDAGCTACPSNRMLISGNSQKQYFGQCKPSRECRATKIQNSHETLNGKKCACETDHCHFCITKLTDGAFTEVCRRCKDGWYRHDGGCVETCPSNLVGSGSRLIGRECIEPAVCKNGVTVGTKKPCVCAFQGATKIQKAPCSTCDCQAGGICEVCHKCNSGKVLNPETSLCEDDCDAAPDGLITYLVGVNGGQCRAPFTCAAGKDEDGEKCKCKISNCVNCDWTSTGASCTRCTNAQYLKNGECVAKSECETPTGEDKEGRECE